MDVSEMVYSLVPLIPFILYVSMRWHRLENPVGNVRGTVITTLAVTLAQVLLVKTSKSPPFELSMGIPILMALAVYYGKLPGLFGGSTGLGLGFALTGKPFYVGLIIGATTGYLSALFADPGDSMKVLTGTTLTGIILVILSIAMASTGGKGKEIAVDIVIVEAVTGIIMSTAVTELKKRIKKVQTFNF